MKIKSKIIALASSILIGTTILGGCARDATVPRTDIKSSASYLSSMADNDFVSGEAFESGKELSLQEKEKLENEWRDETAQQYSMYERYGLSYDKEKDCFFFDGQMVRYFSDPIDEEHTNAFFNKEGIIDLIPVRDGNTKLTRLQKATEEEFVLRTKKQDELEAQFDSVSSFGYSTTYEVGNPNYREDSLEPYISYDIYYDTKLKTWMYSNKQIHIFYDANNLTFTNESATNGINLQVIRDSKGNIKKLIEMTEQDASKIME